MPPKCTICYHSERESIERDLLAGAPLRNIAEQYSVSSTALHRHKTDHLPAALMQSQQAAEVFRADTLVDQVRGLQARALVILTNAEKSGELKTALLAIGQARQNLELLARLLGKLQDQTAVNVAIVTNPEWLTLRARLLAALEPYPDARRAVIEELNADRR